MINIDFPEISNWKPLEQLIARVWLYIKQFAESSSFQPEPYKIPEKFIDYFMFMGVANDSNCPEKKINLYKHKETRGYINIDDDEQCYVCKEGVYKPIESEDAVKMVLKDWLELEKEYK